MSFELRKAPPSALPPPSAANTLATREDSLPDWWREAPSTQEIVRDEGAGTPDWWRESELYRRTAGWLHTTWQLLTRPREFAQEWASGRSAAPNPVGYYFAAFAISTTLYYVSMSTLFGRPSEGSEAVAFLRSALNQLYVPLSCLFFHPALRLGGARRPARATVGLLLFVLGGPVVVGTVLGSLYAVLAPGLGLPQLMVPLVAENASSRALALVEYPSMPLSALLGSWIPLAFYSVVATAAGQRVKYRWGVLGFLATLVGPTLVVAVVTLVVGLLAALLR